MAAVESTGTSSEKINKIAIRKYEKFVGGRFFIFSLSGVSASFGSPPQR